MPPVRLAILLVPSYGRKICNVRAKNAEKLAIFMPKMQKICKNEQGEVNKLGFHLLIPHKYGMNQDEIRKELQDKIAVYRSDMELDITFLKSFI
ncbi:MAG: hypothetical protein IKB16_01095 [Lentisphaeria bacterium]|nr:hypothetical protein [Lentisphaeria bacterium]